MGYPDLKQKKESVKKTLDYKKDEAIFANWWTAFGSIAYIEGESLLLSLDMEGISVSSGSACSAKTLEPSYVQLAMGIKHEEAHGSLQFTFGRWSTDEDVDMVLEVLPGIAARLREMSAFKPGMEYDKTEFGHHGHDEEGE